jgi:hypothetical protein
MRFSRLLAQFLLHGAPRSLLPPLSRALGRDGATRRDHPSQGHGSSPAALNQMPRCTTDKRASVGPEFEPWLDTSTPYPDTSTPTLPRHYPDTTPTLRHSDTPTLPDTPTPVSGQCQAILTVDLIVQCQAVSTVSKQNRHSDTRHPRHPRHPDTRHPRHSDTTGLDAKEVQAQL